MSDTSDDDNIVTPEFVTIMLIHGDEDVMVPAHLNFGKFLLDRIRRTADPNRTCLLNSSTGAKLTYSEFAQYSVRLGAALSQQGVQKGDTVAVGGDPRTIFLPTGLAVMLTGATFTPIEPLCGRAVLVHKLNLTKPKHMICTRQFREAYSDILKNLDFIKTLISFEPTEDVAMSVEELMSSQSHVNVDNYEPAFVTGDDIALITYSSGTTGLSKGVLLTHLNCLIECNTYAQWFDNSDQPLKRGFFGEPNHTSTYDMFMMTGFIFLGKTAIHTDHDIDADFESCLKILQDFKIHMAPTAVAIVETILNAKKDEYDLSSLMMIVAAGSALMPRTAKLFHERYPGIKLINLYGTTEVGAIASTSRNKLLDFEEMKSGTSVEVSCVGYASAGMTLKVVDVETRAPLGPNQRGEVCARSPRLMKGYLGSTATYLDEQGFYVTGDLGYYDDLKRFYLVGRMKDVISFMGYQVAPGDLEVVLLGHPAVQEVAVVGKPASDVGELPTAFVVLRTGAVATEKELVDYVAQQVTWNMRLGGGVRFLPELPKNSRRKVLRNELRDMLNE